MYFVSFKIFYNGLTGPISFDSTGKRTNFTIGVYKVELNSPLKKVGIRFLVKVLFWFKLNRDALLLLDWLLFEREGLEHQRKDVKWTKRQEEDPGKEIHCR